jgi:surface polysaccharide O-acyltransferase-like enzyme
MAAMVLNDEIRGSAAWWVAQTLDSGSSWCVPVFFMVSGALVLAPDPPRSPGEFYRRRLQRVAIPLVVAHLVYFGVRALLVGETLTPGVVVRDLLQAKVYVHLYFFWIIAGLYVVAPLISTFIAARPRREVLWFGATAMAWMLLVTWSDAALRLAHVSSTSWVPALFTLFLPYVGYFVLGHALRDVVLGGRWLLVAVAAFLIADTLHVVAGGGLIRGVPGTLLAGGYQGLPVAITAVTLFLIARTLIVPGTLLAGSSAARMARRLGDLTLGVFVFHLLVKIGLQRTVLSGLSSGQFLADALLLFIAVLVGSFALCAVIARVPVLRRSIGL